MAASKIRRKVQPCPEELTNALTAIEANSSPQAVSITLTLWAILPTTKVASKHDENGNGRPDQRLRESAGIEAAHDRVATIWSTPMRPASKLRPPPAR